MKKILMIAVCAALSAVASLALPTGVSFAQSGQPSNVGADYFLYLSPNLNSSVLEHICDSAGVTDGGRCNGVMLGNLGASDGQNVSENITAPASIWVRKDILSGAGGHQTGISPDFVIPEPATFLLIGGGLALLGLVRRRKKS